jgi:hypothetical protein
MKPVWKWTIGIVLGILLLALGASWYLSRHWKPLFDQRIKEAVIQGTDSLYRVEYEDINLNLVTGKVTLSHFKLIADTSVYKSLESIQKAPDNRFDIEVAQLKINGFLWTKAALSKELILKSIQIDTPTVIMTNTYHLYNDTLVTDTAKKDFFLSGMKKILVDRIGLVGVNFIFDKVTEEGVKRNEFKNVKISLEDVLIDSTSLFDPSRFYYTKAMSIDMGAYQFEIPESYYDLKLDSLYIRTKDKKLVIQGLNYAPRVSKQQFYQELGYAKDITALNFEELTIQELDLGRFMRSQRIRAGKLFVTNGDIDVSNDIRYPRRPVNKIGKSPHQQLMKLNFPLKIDSIFIDNTDISYAEISEKYHKEGKITFERANGWISNVTNDSISLRGNHLMEANITAYVMNEGKLNAQFSFDLLDPKGAFTYKGGLSPMSGKSFNRILTPLLSVEVESARIKGLSFDMQGNDHRNWGTVNFDYDEMKVAVLNTSDDGSTSKKKVVSFLANELLINSANPNANGDYIIGKVNYQRPPTFSFFKTLWKSLFEGVKQTAGISKEREARLMNTAEAAVTIKEKAGNVFQSIFKKRNTNPEDKKE